MLEKISGLNVRLPYVAYLFGRFHRSKVSEAPAPWYRNLGWESARLPRFFPVSAQAFKVKNKKVKKISWRFGDSA